MNEKDIYTAIDRTLAFDMVESGGLFNGSLGWVAFYSHLSKVKADDKYAYRAADLLGDIFAAVDTGGMQMLGYGNGMQGLSMVYLHMIDNEYLKCYVEWETLVEMDNMAIKAFDVLVSQKNFGFENGAAGCMYYILERTKMEPGLLPTMENMLLSIKAAATLDQSGLRFESGNLHGGFANGEFGSHYNLGLKDGMTGILLVLVRIYESWGNIADIAQMIVQGLEFYLQLERAVSVEKQKFCFFPTVVSNLEKVRAEKREFYNSRLGWCIGDLPTAYLFMMAGSVLNLPNLTEKGNLVAEFTLYRRDMTATKVDNAYICHGSAGIARLYRRLYQLSGNFRFIEDGYNYWMDDVFKALKVTGTANISLLNGSLGILWTALSSFTSEENTAEKLLLL